MKNSAPSLTAGVLGTGSLGRNHARLYSGDDRVGAVYLHDQIRERAEAVAAEFGCSVCTSHEELFDKVDMVSVCTPATDHHDPVMNAFDSGIHVLVEKPIASSSEEGERMVTRAEETQLVFQVGHIERFNGTFAAVKGLVDSPLFIESHRLGTFTPRGTDVSVVVDLMIHDIDIVLTLLGKDKLRELRASGAGILTGSPDIVNARLEFESGCVANLTASRISREPLRKVRFFQPNMYISADFRAREVEAFSRSEDITLEKLEADPNSFIKRIDVEVDKSEPLRIEIESFISSVTEGRDVRVTGRQGLEALRLAEKVLESIKKAR